MAYSPVYPTKLTNVSDYVNVPALGTYVATLASSTTALTTAVSNITVAGGDTAYATKGGILEITSGANSGAKRVIDTSTGTSISWVGQPVLTIANATTFNIRMGRSLFDTPTSSTQLKMFHSSYVTGTMDWVTQLRDATIRILTGSGAGQICSIKSFNSTTYIATLYSAVSTLPSAGDEWEIIACNLQCGANSGGNIVVASGLNSQLARTFPAGSIIVALSDNVRGRFDTFVSATLTLITKSTSWGTAFTSLIIRMGNGFVTSPTTSVLLDVSTYYISKMRLFIPVSDGTSYSFYKAKMDDVVTASASYLANSSQVSLTSSTISNNEVVLSDDVTKKYTAYWLENYTSTAINGLQITTEYYK